MNDQLYDMVCLVFLDNLLSFAHAKRAANVQGPLELLGSDKSTMVQVMLQLHPVES